MEVDKIQEEYQRVIEIVEKEKARLRSELEVDDNEEEDRLNQRLKLAHQEAEERITQRRKKYDRDA